MVCLGGLLVVMSFGWWAWGCSGFCLVCFLVVAGGVYGWFR